MWPYPGGETVCKHHFYLGWGSMLCFCVGFFLLQINATGFCSGWSGSIRGSHLDSSESETQREDERSTIWIWPKKCQWTNSLLSYFLKISWNKEKIVNHFLEWRASEQNCDVMGAVGAAFRTGTPESLGTCPHVCWLTGHTCDFPRSTALG